MKAPNGYTSRPSGDDPRSTEAWALGEASRRLALAAKMNDGGESLREALRLNARLWSIFQAALSEPDCPLPQDARAGAKRGPSSSRIASARAGCQSSVRLSIYPHNQGQKRLPTPLEVYTRTAACRNLRLNKE